MGRAEWERAVAFETYERNRNSGLPELPIFPTVDAQVKKQAEDEEAVRQFLVKQRLLTIPPWVKRIFGTRKSPLPEHLLGSHHAH